MKGYLKICTHVIRMYLLLCVVPVVHIRVLGDLTLLLWALVSTRVTQSVCTALTHKSLITFEVRSCLLPAM